MKKDVIIIGAGISGLAAAIHLQNKGRKVFLIEASERPGGRIKTDLHQGFRLDRGFQVLLTAYPEAQKILDFEALNLQKMLPGAHVLFDGGSFEVSDPFRRPSALFSTLFAPVGSLKDKLLTFLLKKNLQKLSIDEIFNQPESTSIERIKQYGFSSKMLNRFYAPFMSGIYLENKLQTSSRIFDFVMKMFSEGDAAIPALGMEEIPKQMASKLPEDCFLFNQKVVDIIDNKVYTEDGNCFEASQVLIATNADELSQRFFPKQNNEKQQVTNVYFEASEAPIKKAIVVLNASEKRKWVTNLTVISNVSADYAPEGKVLISVSCNGILDVEDEKIAENMKKELLSWLGDTVLNWKMLKTYKIQYALPNQNSVVNDLKSSDIQMTESLFICGDHLLNGSINAALKTGRIAAETMMLNREK
jgi:phytoene dehydrogenase-like protein